MASFRTLLVYMWKQSTNTKIRVLKLVPMQQAGLQRWPCTRRVSKQSSLAVQQLKLKVAVLFVTFSCF
ncbi:hypothetical protein E1A91_D10G069800v1 [Gossypium mustelinum]|uniref:Uncharacterized protein n=3 Tax=Gossypium TaxID=3633 RepID=A0A5D2T4T7_GOSMU|nr:hypothetical protein ES288_D10G068700v1 [Gossypium darwinii]TYH48492.1 hypothetical protein ES332_D10G070400v1 [Gossypium tomentosum]TYI59922.1 hypothetical protein E1A91_D10G069800v1 [Gossypium mustelinum]